MADRDNHPIAELGPATRGSAEPRQAGHQVVWDLSEALSQRAALRAIERGLPGVAAALSWAFRLGQQVGHGSMGPGLGCPSCGLRAGFADPAGPVGRVRCVCCDHVWKHGKAASNG